MISFPGGARFLFFTMLVAVTNAGDSIMERDSECYTANGADYEGNQNTTYVTGSGSYEPTYPNVEDCLFWKDIDLGFNVTDEEKALPKNYCRNPNNRLFPYCYVMRNGAQERAYCHIPTCSSPALKGCYKLYVTGTPPPKGSNVTSTGPLPDLILDGEDSMTTDPEMRIARCLNFCRSKKYDYAGLTGGDSCMCGTEKADGEQMKDVLNQLHPHDCLQYPCADDVMQACGGENAIAIYDVEAGSCDPLPFFDRDRGVIYSPRWPGDYHNEAKCQWTVYVPDKYMKDAETRKKYIINVYFTFFNLEKNNDTVKIYAYYNETAEGSKLVGNYTGGSDKLPEPLVLEVSQVMAFHLVFVSDKDQKHEGWIMHFNITTKVEQTTLPDVVVIETTKPVPPTPASTTTPRTTTARTTTTRATTTTRRTTTPAVVTKSTTPKKTPITVPKSLLIPANKTTTTAKTQLKATTSSNTTLQGKKKTTASSSLSGGQIAGIVLGVIVFAVLVVAGVGGFLYMKRKGKNGEAPSSPAMFNNPVTFNSDNTAL